MIYQYDQIDGLRFVGLVDRVQQLSVMRTFVGHQVFPESRKEGLLRYGLGLHPPDLDTQSGYSFRHNFSFIISPLDVPDMLAGIKLKGGLIDRQDQDRTGGPRNDEQLFFGEVAALPFRMRFPAHNHQIILTADLPDHIGYGTYST